MVLLDLLLKAFYSVLLLLHLDLLIFIRSIHKQFMLLKCCPDIFPLFTDLVENFDLCLLDFNHSRIALNLLRQSVQAIRKFSIFFEFAELELVLSFELLILEFHEFFNHSFLLLPGVDSSD